MKHTLLATTFLALSAAACAQNTDSSFQYKGNGYAYFSVGNCLHGYTNVGGVAGGEYFLWRGLTLGADAGYYQFVNDYSSGYGTATVNLGWHFVDRKKPKKFDPYIDATMLGAAFRPGALTGAGHIGGGLNYWFKERIALQTGVQLQVVSNDPVVAFRVGLAFR